MWHEARKQERKIRGMLVDYRKRAERRQDFYEKIKADPTQFMQVHGRKCKIHLDPAIAAAGDSPAIMMPWQGQSDNLIDRFDVRAHLDYIQPLPKVVIEENEEINAEERQCNYERYRILAQNDFLTISEEKYLHQLCLEEQFGVNAQIETEKLQAKKKIGVGVAIGYTYEDSDQIPFNQTMQHIQQNTLMINNSQPQSQPSQMSHQQDKNDSDSDLDVDVPIDISKLDTSQAHELNGCGRNYGMKSNDFYSFLTKDADEADALRMAKEEEIEKNMYSGRKSRRERRAQREKRFIGRHISPPSYAAKEEPVQKTEENNDSDSRSPSPINSGKITYITSFGAEDELPPHSKISINFNKSQKSINSTLGAEILNTTADAKRPLTYAEKVKQNLEKLKTLNNMAGTGNGNNNKVTMGASVIEISKKPIQYQRRDFSGSRSRSRSRPRRNDLMFNSRKRRNRSRSRSHSRSRSYNRRKTKSRSPIRHRSSNVSKSRRSNSRSKSRTRPRHKSRSRQYSTSSTSSSSSTTSVSSSSSSSSTSASSSTSSKSRNSKRKSPIKSNRQSIKKQTRSSSSSSSSRTSSSRSKSLEKNNLKHKLNTLKRSASSESRERSRSPITKKTALNHKLFPKIENSHLLVTETPIQDAQVVVSDAAVTGLTVVATSITLNSNPLHENTEKEKETKIKVESPPIKRYYGRKRDDATSSDDDDMSDDDDDDDDDDKNNKNCSNNDPINVAGIRLDATGLNLTTTSGSSGANNISYGQTIMQPLINVQGSVQGSAFGSSAAILATTLTSHGNSTTQSESILLSPTSVGINFYQNTNNNLNLNNNSMLGKSSATSETKGGGTGNSNVNNLSTLMIAPVCANATVSAGHLTGTGSTFNKFNPRDRLKRKMQILLNKQYKADKKAEIERTERQNQQQQEREDEMRELALKLRRRQRELRHKYGTPTSGSRSPESKTGITVSGDENDLINNSVIAQKQQQMQQQQQQQQKQQNEIKNNLSKETIDKLQKKISSRSRSKSRTTSSTTDNHHHDNNNYQYNNNNERKDKDNRDSKYHHRDSDYRNRDYRYNNNNNNSNNNNSNNNNNNNNNKNNNENDNKDTRNSGSSNSSGFNNNSTVSNNSCNYTNNRGRDRDRNRDRRSNSRERRYKRNESSRSTSNASTSRSNTNNTTTVRRLVDY